MQITSLCRSLSTLVAASKRIALYGLILHTLCGLTPAQQLSGQPTAPYSIQPGDQLEVDFLFTPQYNQTITVQPDGFISLQTAGPLTVKNLTIAEVTALIRARSSNMLYKPVVTVILKDFQRPYFVVAGEVDKPGKFDLRESITALQAILLAGGMKNTARSNQVIVYRRINKEEFEVHLLDLRTIKTEAERHAHDLILAPGDMLLVPRSRFSVVERIVKVANLGLYFNPIPTL